MHKDIYKLERMALKESILHKLNPKIKLIIVLMIIIYGNFQNNIVSLIVLGIYLIFLLFLSGLLFEGLKRMLLIMPFGIFLALFQPFFRGEEVVYHLFIFPIYREGIIFGLTMFLKFLISIIAITILATTTPMYEVIGAMRGLGLPNIMATLLGLMVRYLFLMYEILEKTLSAQNVRCFNRYNLKYKSVLKTFGYTIGTLFVRSYEQGNKTYWAMVSRGYNANSKVVSDKTTINYNDVIFLIITLFIILLSHLLTYL